MHWKLEFEEHLERCETREFPGDGRYVLQRHVDAAGPHLDLRLECGESLRGWRIDATTLDDAPWATEKAPHDLRRLEDADGMETIDWGVYGWETQHRDGGVLLLGSGDSIRRVSITRMPELPAATVRELEEALTHCDAKHEDAARLIRDGACARGRAVGRLCGLGRELDGDAFDEKVWRKSLDQLSLEELHVQLRSFEVRFDQRYPARPMSRSEQLPEERDDRTERAMEILRN